MRGKSGFTSLNKSLHGLGSKTFLKSQFVSSGNKHLFWIERTNISKTCCTFCFNLRILLKLCGVYIHEHNKTLCLYIVFLIFLLINIKQAHLILWRTCKTFMSFLQLNMHQAWLTYTLGLCTNADPFKWPVI